MEKYYKERFEAQRRVGRKLASTMEVNKILERLREEARKVVPTSMEACIFASSLSLSKILLTSIVEASFLPTRKLIRS